jgi:hypothetical protein
MTELLIGKTVIRVPSEFKELRLSTGIEVMNYIDPYPKMGQINKIIVTPEEENKDTSLGYADKVAIISTLSGVEIEFFLKMTKETIEDIYNSLQFLKAEEQQLLFFPSFSLDGKLYGFLNFDNLTTHEYADIDFYLNESEYPLANLDKIMSVLFRPIIKKKQSLKNILTNKIIRLFLRNIVPKVYISYEIEEYKDQHSKNAELFGKRLDMGFSIAAYQNMLRHRQEIINDYPTIFKPEIPEEDKDQYDEEVPDRPQGKTFESVWGLFHCIASLSSTLFEREAWYRKPIREFFTYLSYWNAKTQMENQRAMAQKNT